MEIRWYQMALTGENLTSVYDQIPKSGSRSQKFSNDNTDQRKTDADFHQTDK